MNGLLIGGRGVGKSTLAYYMADQKSKVIIIFDPNNNFREVQGFDDLDAFEDFFANKQYATFDPTTKAEMETGFAVRFLPNPDNIRDDFNNFAWIVRRHCGGTYSLIFDESDEIQSAAKMEAQLAWFMRRAPRECDAPETVHIFQCTHSPQDTYSRARNLIDHFYFFQTQGVAELEYIEKLTGDKEVAALVRTLPLRHFVHFYRMKETGQFTFDVIDDPESWYIDIGSNKGKDAQNAEV